MGILSNEIYLQVALYHDLLLLYHFQERIENLRIVTPFKNVSYAVGKKIRLESDRDKGSNMSYTWTTNGSVYKEENPEVVYNHIGKNKFKFIVSNSSNA